MSLTCRGRCGGLYPLLHEAQPSNSCWQSCLSPNHPLTCQTNHGCQTLEKDAKVVHISVIKRNIWTHTANQKASVKLLVQLVHCEWMLLSKISSKIRLSWLTLDPFLSWTWALIQSKNKKPDVQHSCGRAARTQDKIININGSTYVSWFGFTACVSCTASKGWSTGSKMINVTFIGHCSEEGTIAWLWHELDTTQVHYNLPKLDFSQS